MHHQSIWKDGKPLFAGKEYAGVSQMCLNYISGILKHAPRWRRSPTRRPTRQTIDAGLKRRCCWPTRAVTGRLVFVFPCTPEARRRSGSKCVSPAANPVPLAFAAMLMAGLDGIENKINPESRRKRICTISKAKEAAKDPHHAGQP